MQPNGVISSLDLILHLTIYRILILDSAAIAFSELIEELASTDEGVPLLNEIRKMYAPSIESLRAELKALMK